MCVDVKNNTAGAGIWYSSIEASILYLSASAESQFWIQLLFHANAHTVVGGSK